MIASRTDPVACSKCSGARLVQETDVLDTWFSSGLWPFSTLGWPKETPDYKYFYPTSILETGYDILFFWVARMIMDGIEFTGIPPFHTVYLHGLIRDEHGAKMSKTKGNVIDPLGVMDEMGTDALRFTLLVGATPGNDMNLSVKKVEANRNFINKIWNASRFVITSIPGAPDHADAQPKWTLADLWIQTRMNQLIREVDRLFAAHQYGEAGRQIYEFFWSEFADWYVEISKKQMAGGGDMAYYTAHTLVNILDKTLRLLHPFVPYITEELWGYLRDTCNNHAAGFIPKSGWKEALMIAEWPGADTVSKDEETILQDFSLVMDIVRSIRNFRTEKNVKPGSKLEAVIAAGSRKKMIQNQVVVISALAHLDHDRLTVIDSIKEKQAQPGIVVSGVEIFLTLENIINKDEEKQRLESELKEAEIQIERLRTLLGGSFAERAPAAVVEKEKQKLVTFQQTAEKVKKQLEALN